MSASGVLCGEPYDKELRELGEVLPVGPFPPTGEGWKRSRWTKTQGGPRPRAATQLLQGLLLPITGPRSALLQESSSAYSQMVFSMEPSPREAASGTAHQSEMLPFIWPSCVHSAGQCAYCLDSANELWQRSWSQPSTSGKPRLHHEPQICSNPGSSWALSVP